MKILGRETRSWWGGNRVGGEQGMRKSDRMAEAIRDETGAAWARAWDGE